MARLLLASYNIAHALASDFGLAWACLPSLRYLYKPIALYSLPLVVVDGEVLEKE
jgi:hypothetical protein